VLKGQEKYPHVFQPIRVGKFTSKNRMKFAACSVSNYCSCEGFLTEREYHRMIEIAGCGAGIITNQGAYPDPRGEGKGYFRQAAIFDDKFIPGLRRLADLIHENGAIAIEQVLHAGRYGGIENDYCIQPTATPQSLRHFRPPKEMTKDEIKRSLREHVEAAKRAIIAGFDGVEIHGFMGYHVPNFLSRFTNKRTDEYGGSTENRARFMVEMIQGMRAEIGNEHLLGIRLNFIEFMDEVGGNTPDECLEIIKIAEQAGVDYISLLVGWHESRQSTLGRDVPIGHWFTYGGYLERVSREVKVPILFGPRLGSSVQLVEKALSEDIFHIWEICRPLLADPKMLHKIAEGSEEEIRPCVGDMLCLARLFRSLPYTCCVNARLGHEYEPEYEIKPAAVGKKSITVIGAGPAGLECAVTAALRGHHVELYDKKQEIGGQAKLLAENELTGGEDLRKLLAYYDVQLGKLGINVELGTEVTPKRIGKKIPDVVVLATGASVVLNGEAWTKDHRVVSAFDVLEGKVDVGENIVVIGGNKVGVVTAESLANNRKRVCIVESSSSIGQDITPTFKWRHTAWIKELSIETLTDAHVVGLSSKGVEVRTDDRDLKTLSADNIVVCMPYKSQQELYIALEFLCDEIYIIGDAVTPRSVHNAIHEGFRLGVRI